MAAARTQLIDVRRALEVLGVTQLRRPRPAGFRRSATFARPKGGRQSARPTQRGVRRRRGRGQSAGKKIWRRLKKKPQNFPLF
eukprot:scaffold29018_cov75-Phaeocystis_antarctica.AAC.2